MNMKIITMVLLISQLIIVSESSYYYKFFKVDKTCGSYEEGKKICKDAGGELAVIESKNDLNKACYEVDGGSHPHYMIDALRTTLLQWHKLSDNSYFLFDHTSPLWDAGEPKFDLLAKFVGVTAKAHCKLHSLFLSDLRKSGVLCQIREAGRNCIPTPNPFERVCGIDLRGTLANTVQLLPREIQIYDVFQFAFESQSDKNLYLRIDLLNHEMESVWNFAIDFKNKKFYVEYTLVPALSGAYFPFVVNVHYVIVLHFLPTKVALGIFDHYGSQIALSYFATLHNEIKQVKKIRFTGKSEMDCANIYVCEIKFFCKTPSPTQYPSETPTTSKPTRYPSETPTTTKPTRYPSETPTTSKPTRYPSETPTTSKPTRYPSETPTTSKPTRYPSETPTTSKPTRYPSETPTTSNPTRSPTYEEMCIPYCWQFDPFICKDPRRTNIEICGADNSFKYNKLKMILSLSQANRMYGKCKGLCVYSLVDPSAAAFKWDKINECWNVVYGGDQDCYITHHNDFKHVQHLWLNGCYECKNIELKLTPCDDSIKRSNFVDCATGQLSIELYLGQANGYYKDCDCQCVHTYPSKIPYEWNPYQKCWKKALYGQCTEDPEKDAVYKREEEICLKKHPFEYEQPMSYLNDYAIQNQQQEKQQQEKQQEQQNAETFPKSYPLNVKYLMLSIIFIVFAVVGVKLFQKNSQKNVFPHETTPLMELVNKY